MPPVPQGYPFGLSDDDLKNTLTGMMDPASWPGFDDFGRLLPELKLALLAAGIHEQGRRESAAASARSSATSSAGWPSTTRCSASPTSRRSPATATAT